MKKNSGVTLIVLIIMIIILVILASVGTATGISYMKQLRVNKFITELDMVQHAVLEQYTMYISTGNSSYIVGEKLQNGKDYISNLFDGNITPTDNSGEENYYRLTPDDLLEIGLEKGEDTYIVNYITGEAINESKVYNEDGAMLYIKGRNK